MSGRGREQRVLLAVLALLVASLLGAAATSVIQTPKEAAADGKDPGRGRLTAAVERRVLTQDLVLRGDLVSETEIALKAQAVFDAERVVVSGLRVRAGEPVKAGDVVIELSGRPVIVLPGEVPSYRDLRPNSKGRDVVQLQRSLNALGYVVRESGTLDARTQAAVAQMYRDRGYEPATTGPEAAAALADARRAVRDAERALARTGSEPDAAGRTPVEEDLRLALADARLAFESAREQTGIVVPVGETAFITGLPGVVGEVNVSLGQAAPDSLLSIRTGGLLAVADLDGGPSAGEGVKRGLAAVIVLDDGTRLSGSVKTVRPAPVEGPKSADDGNPVERKLPQVVVAGKPALPVKLAGQSAVVTIELGRTEGEQLVVPLSAVYAEPNGSSTVRRVDERGDETAVPVDILLVAQGTAAVVARNGDLQEGAAVTVGSQ